AARSGAERLLERRDLARHLGAAPRDLGEALLGLLDPARELGALGLVARDLAREFGDGGVAGLDVGARRRGARVGLAAFGFGAGGDGIELGLLACERRQCRGGVGEQRLLAGAVVVDLLQPRLGLAGGLRHALLLGGDGFALDLR